jgi:hypothetical protein
MGELEGKWPGVKWGEGRWVRDGRGKGEVWTSGELRLHFWYLFVEGLRVMCLQEWMVRKDYMLMEEYRWRHEWSRHGGCIYSREIPGAVVGYGVYASRCRG